MLSPDRPPVLHGLLRLRQHGQRQPPDRQKFIVDCLQYWVDGDARRRLPLRRGLGAVPRRRRRADGGPAGAVGHRAVRDAVGHEDDRRGVGRRRPLPGRPLPRLALGGVERPLPRRRAPLRQAATSGSSATIATRIAGSSDLYQGAASEMPTNSINFVTCHDGFTLNDLVALQRQAQRGQRRGQPRRHRRQPELELRRRRARPTIRRSSALRERQIKNFAAILLLCRRACRCSSPATSSRRTQRGNNNAYCQDNESELVRLGSGRAATPTCSASSSR